MRNLDYLNQYRVNLYGKWGDEYNGAFIILIDGYDYKVIASNGLGWEHISVSAEKKTPTWRIMNIIKSMFFEDDEVAMQLHPAKADYINNHKHCLHLWRPLNEKIPMPLKEFV